MFGHDWQPAAGTVVDTRLKHPNSENDSRSWLMEVHCVTRSHSGPSWAIPASRGLQGSGTGRDRPVKADLKRKDAKWDLSDPH